MTAPALLAQPVARLSDDGRTVLLSRGGWSGSFPLSRLPSQIAFYRGLRDRKGGKYAAFYQPTLAALEALSDEIRRRSDDRAGQGNRPEGPIRC